MKGGGMNLAIMLGKPKGKPGMEDDEEDRDDGEEEGGAEEAQAVLDAIESKDAEVFASALRRFVRVCC